MTDLVEMSTVGLYEFIWTLRPRYPEMSFAEYRMIAERALLRVLDSIDCRLVWLTWPSDAVVREHPCHEVEARDWEDPTEEPYLALTANDAAGD